MKTRYGNLVVALLLLYAVSLYGMVPENAGTDKAIGKIVTKAEADKLFGPVLKSVTFSVNEVRQLVSSTNNSVMFNIKDGNLFILNDNRRVLFPAGASVLANETFHRYSKSKVIELLDLAQGSEILFEVRANVFCITGGAYTLEYGVLCPPICD